MFREVEILHEVWSAQVKRHLAIIGPIADAFLKRRGVGQTDPVHDFLFTYYNCSPQKLKQWVPSFEEKLVITPNVREEYPWLTEYWFSIEGNLLSYRKERLHKNVLGLAKFIRELCKNITGRVPRFGCFGLHEWAMVYKLSPEELRHKKHRLRLSPKELGSFVESQTMCCSHYDAYRFFTKDAQPLNTLNPALNTRLQLEQGGCLHANMDLYKWATKLWPWIGSDFIAKSFMLALEGRELDMRASPYDLTAEGYAPICIEKEEGRKQYQKEQQLYAERSAILRDELQVFCERFIQQSKISRLH